MRKLVEDLRRHSLWITEVTSSMRAEGVLPARLLDGVEQTRELLERAAEAIEMDQKQATRAAELLDEQRARLLQLSNIIVDTHKALGSCSATIVQLADFAAAQHRWKGSDDV